LLVQGPLPAPRFRPPPLTLPFLSLRRYLAFIRSSSRFGRQALDRIQAETGRPYSEVERYAKRFWDPEIGKKRVSEREYSRVEAAVLKGEEKLLQVISFEKCTKLLLETFDNPWTDFE
jgi:hypothetical protein